MQSSPLPQPAATDTGMSPTQRHVAQGIDAMLVDIQVETGQLTMPLSTLRNLAVGQVFDTLQPMDSNNLVLWVGGQRLGLGQLVAVGDRVGVRIAVLDATPALPSPIAAPAASASSVPATSNQPNLPIPPSGQQHGHQVTG